jgi:hypothetical protein
MSDLDPLTPPTADHAARIGQDLADIGESTGLTLYTGRTPDEDGLVWCCATLGRVTPPVAHDHVEDTLQWAIPGY